jgi:Sec-independent protein translocase protein TatA
MNIFGIGPLELTLIVIIALIVLGPNDLAKTGRTLGRWMRKIVTSQEWRTVQHASRELRTLPNKLMREAGIEEAQRAMKEQMAGVKKIGQDIQGDIQNIQTDLSSWVMPSPTIAPPQVEQDSETTTEDTTDTDPSPADKA